MLSYYGLFMNICIWSVVLLDEYEVVISFILIRVVFFLVENLLDCVYEI